MSQLPQPVNNHNGNDPLRRPPQIVLLDDKQWLYVQKRYRMTLRECEIAKLVCRGLSNEEIAQSLKISQGTVKTHIRNIYRKTWARNKIAMLLRFLEDAAALSPATYSYLGS